MARMIDADELIKFFQEMKEKYQEAASDATSDYGITILGKVAKVYENAITMVNAQPTAYDVGKVVAELEQQTEQYKRRALELVEKSIEAGIHNKGKACSYEHAIEIVRKGGVE